MGQYRPDYPGHFVSQPYSGNVEVSSLSKVAGPPQLAIRFVSCTAQGTSRAMNQECAQMAVAFARDTVQALLASTTMLSWHEPEIGREIAATSEMVWVSHTGHDCCCSQWPYAWHFHQLLGHLGLGSLIQLSLVRQNPLLFIVELLLEFPECRQRQAREAVIRICQPSQQPNLELCDTGSKHPAIFSSKSTNTIDHRYALAHQSTTRPMKHLQILLCWRVDRHILGRTPGAGLGNGSSIIGIVLVTSNKCSRMLRSDQLDVVTQCCQLPCPVMRTGACFDTYRHRLQLPERRQYLVTLHLVLENSLAVTIQTYRDKHFLRDIQASYFCVSIHSDSPSWSFSSSAQSGALGTMMPLSGGWSPSHYGGHAVPTRKVAPCWRFFEYTPAMYRSVTNDHLDASTSIRLCDSKSVN